MQNPKISTPINRKSWQDLLKYSPGVVLLQKILPRCRAFDHLKKIPRGSARGGCSRLELTDALTSFSDSISYVNFYFRNGALKWNLNKSNFLGKGIIVRVSKEDFYSRGEWTMLKSLHFILAQSGTSIEFRPLSFKLPLSSLEWFNQRRLSKFNYLR